MKLDIVTKKRVQIKPRRHPQRLVKETPIFSRSVGQGESIKTMKEVSKDNGS
jgi:hypothetical protein